MPKSDSTQEDWLFNEAVKLFDEHEDQAARVLFEEVIALKGVRAVEAEHYVHRIKDREYVFCASCGTRFIQEVAFCPSCGSPAPGEELIHFGGSKAERDAGKPDMPIFSGRGKGRSKVSSAGLPTEAVIRRTPHMDISSDAVGEITRPLSTLARRAPGKGISGITTTVRTDVMLTVSIYADNAEPRPGEQIEEIELQALPHLKSFSVEVRLLVTGHFIIESEPVKNILIERDKERSNSAEFRVRVRTKEQLAERNLEAAVAGITAAFAYNGRASGRVARIIRIAEYAAFEDALRPERATRATLLLDALAEPADVSLVILAAPANDGRQFWCTVRTPLLVDYSRGVTEEWNLANVTSNMVAAFMKGFTDKRATERQRVYSLRGAGKLLFEASPEVFQKVFWKLVDAGKLPGSISIVSEEPFIPWELMVPNRSVDGMTETRAALGVEFLIGRWTSDGASAARQKIPVSDCCVVAPNYVGPKCLKYSTTEAEFVLKGFPGKRIDPADFGSVDIGLQMERRSLVHFICHGSDEEVGKQVILLEKNTSIDSVSLLGMEGVEKAFNESRPFIFLNACEVGRLAPALVGVGGFARSFIELGASAVIAPLWSVKDDIAHEVATVFYEATLKNPDKPFAEILREIRQKSYDPAGAEDTYAAYCFYGDPLAARAVAD